MAAKQSRSLCVPRNRKACPMLFLESKTLNYAVEGEARIRLLQQLQERELKPLIRSTRLRCFEDVLLNVDQAGEVEASLASWNHTTIDEPYVRGDLFCFQDRSEEHTSELQS